MHIINDDIRFQQIYNIWNEIIFEEIYWFVLSTSYFFQKYLCWSKSKRLGNGTTPENGLIIEGDGDFGAPKRFFNAWV